ncbi:hypothetical protein CONLIGDRAFT_46553 [Coniochaeta ligniaria NRRL 30616]|uniref:Uncharacterized protein n=1 Tax=Coniochaeta ligniaria NRRL 30616 TaxID=1408157 RepID=A0A1J7K0I2_9PEZI|nr:hypothetical protein CONLIGDRAFT_46553 [Coniochaeta ligniaria NRRL 30616]
MSKADIVDSSTEGTKEGSCRSTLSVAGLSVFTVSMDDAFSRADDSTIVAQELLGRRLRLAEEGLLSPCAGGLEWAARLLSTGWIAVGDEIWLAMATAVWLDFSWTAPFGLAVLQSAAGSEQRGCCARRGDSKSAVKSKLRGQLPGLADARWSSY